MSFHSAFRQQYLWPVLVTFTLLLIVSVGYKFSRRAFENTQTQAIVPTSRPRQTTPTPTPTETPIPATPTPTPLPLFNLAIAAIDFSHARPAGIIDDVKIKLYASTGELIAEKTPSPHVVTGQVGSGGEASFAVPLGTYKAEAISDRLKAKGTIDITLKSFKDDEHYTIYMKAREIHISGRYFIDSNKNTQYDQGEQLLSGKKMWVIVNTEGRLYTAAETTTDDHGNFSAYPTITGSYMVNADGVPGNIPMSERWINLNGGDSVEYDVYAQPQ